ncbi:MAG: hypothetical protein JSS97_02300 [Actinobacteria bacterium]|nr:hypothetical protein [Actinomycetota bacterium]
MLDIVRAMSRGFTVGVCVLCALVLSAVAVSSAAGAAPANDNFANAQVLSGPLPLETTGTNLEATLEVGEPSPPEIEPAGHSIWYRWEATSSGNVSVDTCGSDIGTALAVYTGGSLGALNLVGADQRTQPPGCQFNASAVVFSAVVGTVYSISVDGVRNGLGSEGEIDLEIEHPQPPANDDFVDAEPITATTEALPEGFGFTNWGATKEPGEPAHRGNQGGASVWFEWTAPHSGGALFRSCDQSNEEEELVAVYTGPTIGALSPVPQIAPTSGTCSYFFPASAGVTYRIAVDGRFNPATGTGKMFQTRGSLRYVPSNDQFEDAEDLINPFTGQPYTGLLWAGPSNVGATKQPGEPDHAGNAGGASVWFKWTAPETGSVLMSACDASFPTLMGAYVGSSVSTLTPVASGTGPAGLGGCLGEDSTTGEIAFDVRVGATYEIAVDGRDGATGSFDLNLRASGKPLQAPTEPTPPPTRPTTKITHRHIDQRRRTAIFSLQSNLAGSTFRCKLDQRRFARCGKRVVYRHLKPGRHRFAAEAVGLTGLVAEQSAKAAFVIRPRHHPRRNRGCPGAGVVVRCSPMPSSDAGGRCLTTWRDSGTTIDIAAGCPE